MNTLSEIIHNEIAHNAKVVYIWIWSNAEFAGAAWAAQT